MSNLNLAYGEPEVDTWGTKGHLTTEQNKAFADFMAVAEESDLDLAKFNVESMESICLRFLRARQFSVLKALELLKQCVKKKAAGKAKHFAMMNPDDVLNCDLEIFRHFYPHSNLGYDRLNRPILYEQSGRVNPSAIAAITTPAALVDYHFKTMEGDLNDMFEQANSTQTPAMFSTCAVVDLEGLSLVHCTGFAFEHLKSMVALDNICYPETLGKMIVVNAPWLAVTTWDIVKGWLDPRTQAKIEILGSGPETSAKLLKYIDANVLPVKYGGTSPDWTSARPLAEYLTLSRTSDVRREVTVPSGHTLYVETYVPAGEIVVEVYTFPEHAEEETKVETASEHSTSTDSNHKKGRVKLSTLTQLAKVTLHGHSGSSPVRHKQQFTNPTEEGSMSFLVRWTSSAFFKSRSVVANVYVEADPAEVR